MMSVQWNGRSVIHAALLLGLIATAAAPARAENLLPYFPQSSGQFFRYNCQSSDGDSSDRVTVSTRFGSGTTIFDQSDPAACVGTLIFEFSSNSAGISLFRQQSAEGSAEYQPPFLFIPANASVGQSFQSSGTLPGIPGVTLTYTANVEILAFEDHRVPSGLFTSALKVRQTQNIVAQTSFGTFTQTDRDTVWFGKDVGEIKRIGEHFVDGTPDGSYQLELTYPGPDCKDECEESEAGPGSVDLASGSAGEVAVVSVSGDESVEMKMTYDPGGISAVLYGTAWHHSFDRSLLFVQLASPRRAILRRPNGKQVSFVEVPNNPLNGQPRFNPVDPDMNSRLIVTASQFVNGVQVPTAWKYQTSDDLVETYDANGRLTSTLDRGNPRLALTYSSAPGPGVPSPGLLVGVANPHGLGLQLEYDSSSRLRFVKRGAQILTTHAYDTSGRLASITYADGTSQQYFYNETAYLPAGASFPGALTGIIDEAGIRLQTRRYDALGRIIERTLAGNADRQTYAYNSAGQTSVTDALNTTRVATYAKVLGVTRPTGISTTSGGRFMRGDASRIHDAQGNVTSRRDFRNNLTCHAYDLTRNLETVRVEGFASTVLVCPLSLATYVPATGTRERKITTAWHSSFRLPTSITEPNRTTSFTHDPNGNVLTRTVTDTSVAPNVSRIWTYTYNSFGKVLTENGPRTDVTDFTTYTYYNCTTGFQCGQVNSITNALNHVVTFNAYNVHGQPTQITDANGQVTNLGYDTRQRLAQRCVGAALPTCTGGELIALTYWPIGLLRRVTIPDGSFVQYTYDNAHRLTQIEDGQGNRIVYTLDNAGHRTAENIYDVSSNLKRTHSQIFNSLSQLWKDVNAAGTAAVTTTLGYDPNGNQTTTNAPLSRNSTSFYDELNRLNQITDPGSGVTAFVYDANDNLTTVTDPRSLATNYTYTGFGDLKTQVSPDTGLTTNTFDSGGNLRTSADARSAITTHTYDALNRVTSAAFKIGATTDQTITYSYDSGTNQKGRLTGASDSTHTMAWVYDTKGRVTGKTQTYTAVSPNVPMTMGYGYNAFGQRTSHVLPSGKVILYGYNANNQVSSVTLQGSPSVAIVSNVAYDPFGPIKGWTWGNSTTTARVFDTDGKLTSIVNSASAVGNRTFGYDDAFRITSATDNAAGGPAWTFGYSNLDRLNSATKTGTTIGYTYDANGNRLTQTGTSASTHTVSGTSNRLSSVSGALTRSYLYDLAGNTTQSGATIHSYNNRGRMKTGRLASTGTDTSYVYNALGQRIRKSGGIPSTLYFAYDEVGHLVGEYTWSGSALVLVQETVWLEDIPVATLRPNGANVDVFYVHSDQLNTPRKVTVSTGTNANKLRWKWDPNPYGEGSPNENPSVPALGAFKYHLRFPGQYFDAETNLSYNYFRDYDPAIGRFAQSDPIGLSGGLNSYAYGSANPLSNFDPLGLDPLVLGDGYTGRLDKFMYQGDASFEIHVFDKSGKEVGVHGPSGWINKHGHVGPPKALPTNVCDSVKGITIDELRKRNRFPPKGTVNIKGDKWKYFVKFGGSAAVVGNIYSNLSIERLCAMDPENGVCGGPQ